MHSTAWRWQRPHSICAYMLWDASSHSTAAGGLVWPPRLVGSYGRLLVVAVQEACHDGVRRQAARRRRPRLDEVEVETTTAGTRQAARSIIMQIK
jgi:hypothetical protein